MELPRWAVKEKWGKNVCEAGSTLPEWQNVQKLRGWLSQGWSETSSFTEWLELNGLNWFVCRTKSYPVVWPIN
jgi:hypothetical protein